MSTDMEQIEDVHQALEPRDLLPAPHLVDAGYIDAGLLLTTQHHYHIDLVGPVSQNNQWQVKKGGYDASQFQVDWQRKQVTCPQGKQSVKWTPGTNQYGHPNVEVLFGLRDCRACPARSLCTRSATAPRHLTMRRQAEYEILQQARLRQQTEAFQKLYAGRSGIEVGHSQTVRTMGLHRTRYYGLAKTSSQHVFTALALNLVRLDAYLAGAKATKRDTRVFAALAPVALAS